MFRVHLCDLLYQIVTADLGKNVLGILLCFSLLGNRHHKLVDLSLFGGRAVFQEFIDLVGHLFNCRFCISVGLISVSADGKRFFWAPENATALYYSDDYGDTWNTCGNIYVTKYVVCDTVNPNYVYATTSGGFYVSSDGGLTFESTFTMFNAVRITVVPGKEGEVYLPGTGLQISTNHGKTFTRNENIAVATGVGVGKGKDEGSPDAIYIWGKPTKDDTLGIYWSTDGGSTWSPVTQGNMQFGGMGNGYFIKGDVHEY